MSELSRATGEPSPEAAAVIDSIRALLDRPLTDKEDSTQLIRDLWHVYDAARDAFPEAWHVANAAGPARVTYRDLCRTFDKPSPTVARYVRLGRKLRGAA